MANRYLNLFKLPERLYAKGSPIIIETGALHKDSVLGDVVAQLKFRSIVPQNITSVTVDITCFNAAKEIITPSFIYKYDNIIVNENEQFFGSKTLITLPHNDTRSFSVKITNVEFSDGSTVIITENQWNSIPKQNDLSSFDNVFVEYFRKKYGNTANILPTEYNDLWLCTCGQENKKDEMVCKRCGITYSEVFPFDIEQEKKNAIYEFAKEKMNSCLYVEAIELFESIVGWKDADEQIIACQRKIEVYIAEEKTKKKKRNVIISIVTSVTCAVIAFIVVLNAVIIPTIKRNDEIARMDSKYDNAVALIEEGKYCDAYKALIALNGYKDSVEKSQSIYNQCVTESLTKAQAGNYVYFGTYEQDNDSSNGNEFIEWIVLEIKDSKALVISKYALDCLQYDPEFDSVTWEQCNLRKWLNDNFINSAFTSDEIKKVVTSMVPADQNPYYNPKPGNPTQDKVFLLSLTEVEKYFKEENDRVCDATEYAYNQGARHYSGGCEWWLRTPGDYTSWAATVTFEGGVTHQGDRVDSVENAVRPAMWIDLS